MNKTKNNLPVEKRYFTLSEKLHQIRLATGKHEGTARLCQQSNKITQALSMLDGIAPNSTYDSHDLLKQEN